MSRETLDLMLGLDRRELETQVALQCAPLLTGLKVSNLLTVERPFRAEVGRLFENTPVSCYLLYQSEEKVTFLLYIRDRLKRCLSKPQVCRLMEQFGYCRRSLTEILPQVAARYRAHMEQGAAFPHEIGLLLGYPPEDVRGFIENEGRNCLYIGYWKVYSNLADRLRVFAGYNWAREQVIRLFAGGMNVRRIMECYHLHYYKTMTI